MGIFDSIGQWATKLQPLGDMMSSYNNEQTMNNAFAANPEFATQLYGAKNAQADLDYKKNYLTLAQQQQALKEHQQTALENLSKSLATGQTPTRSALAQFAAISGDPSTLLNYQIQQDKLQGEQSKQRSIAQILAGGSAPVGINPAAPSPLSVQNNNAGNIRAPDGSFKQFNSPQEGYDAMTQDLTAKISGKSPAMVANYGQGYVPTLSTVLNTYAPPSENDTNGYIDFVSKQTGIDPNQPLSPMDIAKIQPAMVKMEGGSAASNYFNPQSMMAPQTVQPDQPTAQPAQPSEPSSLDQLAQLAQIDPETYGKTYIDAKQTAEKEQKKTEDSVITPDNADLHGEEFLNTIQNADVKNKAKALLRGDTPYPSINSRTPSNIKQALEAAQQADPSYTAANYPVRVAAKKAFTSGPEGRNVNAINTLIGHLGELKKAADELDNGPLTPMNYIENAVGSKASDKTNAKVRSYEIAKNAVASEAAKAYKGVGAISVEEQKEWQNNLSPNLGPEAQKQTTQEIAKLLVGKLGALESQYQSAFPNENKTFVNQKSIKTLKDLGIDPTELGLDEGVSAEPTNTPNKTVNYKVVNGQLVAQ